MAIEIPCSSGSHPLPEVSIDNPMYLPTSTGGANYLFSFLYFKRNNSLIAAGPSRAIPIPFLSFGYL